MFVIKVKITPIEVLPFIERPRIAESRDESEWEDGGLTPEQQRARSEVGPPYNRTVQYSTPEHNSSSIFGSRTPFIPSMHNMQIVSLVITQSRGVLTVNSTTTLIVYCSNTMVLLLLVKKRKGNLFMKSNFTWPISSREWYSYSENNIWKHLSNERSFYS